VVFVYLGGGRAAAQDKNAMLVVVKAGDVNNVQALLDTNPWLVQAQVAYLRPAGNVSRPLPYRLRYMNQPVLSPPNRFSPSRSILMACM